MRRKTAEKRDVQPDPIFEDKLITRFVNNLMRDGKKNVARKIVYQAFEIIEEKTGETGIDIFKSAMQNATPVVEVKSRRVGGATYQVPMEVKIDRSQALAIRWIIDAARKRGGKNMKMKLYQEFLDAHENKGGAVKKREDTHRMAESNKAFAHFRW